MKKLFTIFFILLLLNKIYPHKIAPLYDFWIILKSPFNTEKNNLIKITTFSTITLSLFLFDQKIQDYFQNNKNQSFNNFLKYPEKMGDGKYIISLSSLMIIYGLTFNNEKVLKSGIYSAESFLISGIIVSGIKFIFGRARPYTKEGSFYFKPFNFKTAYTSFYSGHTTVAFAFASTISYFTKNIYISSLLYSIATLTGVQRIYSNNHYISDVFVGAVSGILIGKKVVELNEIEYKNDNNEEKIKIILWRYEIN